MVRIDSNDAQIDAIVLDDRATEPTGIEAGNTALYTTVSGVYTLVSGSSPISLSNNTTGIQIPLLANDTALEVGDDFPNFYWIVPSYFNGYTITSVDFWVAVASTSGIPEFQIHNVTDAVDILSTECTIDQDEENSYTAATSAVIASGSLATGDQVRFDCETAGTHTTGCGVILVIGI